MFTGLFVAAFSVPALSVEMDCDEREMCDFSPGNGFVSIAAMLTRARNLKAFIVRNGISAEWSNVS